MNLEYMRKMVELGMPDKGLPWYNRVDATNLANMLERAGYGDNPDGEAAYIIAVSPQRILALLELADRVDHFVKNYNDFHFHPEFTPVAKALANIKVAK